LTATTTIRQGPLEESCAIPAIGAYGLGRRLTGI
jgi:hypothetical protein